MASQAELTYQAVFVNGALLSRRYIVDEFGTALDATDVSSITLNVYRLSQTVSGSFERTGVENWTGIALPVAEVIQTPITSPSGKRYNFRYCVESPFTDSNTTYLVEYQILTSTGHTIIILIQANTTA